LPFSIAGITKWGSIYFQCQAAILLALNPSDTGPLVAGVNTHC
jgi:hypothetical protein